MDKFRVVFIQHNLAKRHLPTAQLVKLMEDMGSFYNNKSNVFKLRERIAKNEISCMCEYLTRLADQNGSLPRVIPIAIVQEPLLNSRTGAISLGSLKPLYRGDRPRACLATLPGVNLTLVSSLSGNDLAIGNLSYGGTDTYICSYYHDINIMSISRELESAVNKYAPTNHIIIGSDTNAHSSLWGSSSNNSRGDAWELFIASSDLDVINDSIEPTFRGHLGHSFIDVSITNRLNLISNWQNTTETNDSDHCVILFSLGPHVESKSKLVQNIANTNWSLFKDTLNPFLHSRDICSTGELNFRARELISNIIQAFSKACPPKRPLPFTPLKWWTKELTTLANKKKYASREAKRFEGTNRGSRAIIKKRELGRLLQKFQRRAKSKGWKDFISGLSSFKQISSLFKKMRVGEKKSEMPYLILNGKMAENSAENLRFLKEKHFNNSDLIFSRNDGDNEPLKVSLSPQLEKFFTIDLLKRAIKDSPMGKAPGYDGIKNEILKNLPESYLTELLTQFKYSIATGYIPPCWLDVKTIFIEKGGGKEKTDPKAYRPIGLSSSVLKICERMVNWRLKTTVLSQGIPKQHAFTLGRSTETALSEVVHILEKAKHNGQKALLLSIDIQGAFDTIPFQVMKDALLKHGTDKTLVNWLDYMAKNRNVFISQGDQTLAFRPNEGTTQGGHNGPDLWNIGIWDVVDISAVSKVFVCKYADDYIAVLIGIDITSMCELMQTILNELSEWFTKRGLKIAAQKSHCLPVNLAKNDNLKPLSLGEHRIDYVGEIKYLGVIIDSNLTWRAHVESRVKRAKRDLMAAKRLISKSWGLTPSRMKWVYEGIVRPALDYACHVWHKPTPNAWVKKELDKVQRLALVCITSCIRSSPTVALERLLNIPPLDLHLSYKACTTVKRIYNVVNKSNWDGIGKKNGRSHLFTWRNFEKSTYPVINECIYNLNHFDIETKSSQFSPQDCYEIYTDGSKSESGIGAAWVVFRGDNIIMKEKYKLQSHASVYEAESLAPLYGNKRNTERKIPTQYGIFFLL